MEFNVLCDGLPCGKRQLNVGDIVDYGEENVGEVESISLLSKEASIKVDTGVYHIVSFSDINFILA